MIVKILQKDGQMGRFLWCLKMHPLENRTVTLNQRLQSRHTSTRSTIQVLKLVRSTYREYTSHIYLYHNVLSLSTSPASHDHLPLFSINFYTQAMQVKKEKADAVARGRGERRAKDFLEREFADEDKSTLTSVMSAVEVRS